MASHDVIGQWQPDVCARYAERSQDRATVAGQAGKGTLLMDDPDSQTIQDNGDLRKWRTEIPNIIDDLGLDPYQRTLYAHYKKVCGANGGKCTEGVRTTGQKTGMSTAKVSLVRRELADRGLIIAIEQPPKADYAHPQVFVGIVDIWELNFYYYSAKDRPDIDGWTVAQLKAWQVSVYVVNAKQEEKPEERLPDKQDRLPRKRERLPRKQKKEPIKKEPSKKELNNGAVAPSTPLQRQLTALWGVKRLNCSQAELIDSFNVYPYETVIEAAKWAHIKPMKFGDALISLKTALPTWGQKGVSSNGSKSNGSHGGRVPQRNQEYKVAKASDFDPIVGDGANAHGP